MIVDQPQNISSLLAMKLLLGIARNNLPLIFPQWKQMNVHSYKPLGQRGYWLQQLLVDVGFLQTEATSILYNNQGCIAFVKNLIHISCLKYIDVQHHSI